MLRLGLSKLVLQEESIELGNWICALLVDLQGSALKLRCWSLDWAVLGVCHSSCPTHQLCMSIDPRGACMYLPLSACFALQNAQNYTKQERREQ